MSYVDRVRPLLTDEAKSTFRKIWEDILDLPEVADKVYQSGKQWGTNFNRALVANILYHLRTRKIYKDVYHDDINGAALAYALEQNKEHSVKHSLREDPPKDVRDAIDAMLAKKYWRLLKLKFHRLAPLLLVAIHKRRKMKKPAPLTVEDKHGTVIYQIQNMVVNINAETVEQLNTNPQQVVNVIKEQVKAEIEKLQA